MEMWLKVTVILWMLHTLPCSIVLDRADQEGIYYKEYCPKMRFCAEGAHTMCMYYNPNRIHGPRCSNFQNISISSDVAEELLDLVNEMRGQVAMGRETGHGNVTLPRAYGMYKLKWDNELATFAQVLANTCILRHDLCRATKKFEDPGQLASLVRFTIPDWLPVLHRNRFKEKGLIKSKVEYAAQEAYKSWYQQKQHVTVDMVKNVPDWLAQPSRTQGKMFLQLIDGRATHMGCGISAYVEYAYHGKNANEIIFNSIHVTCNFSSQPRKGTSVYETNNTDNGCGCPEDTEFDDRCLCTDPTPKEEPRSCGKDKNCKPAVVLLPIFTVEDAPQHSSARKGMSGGFNSAVNEEVQSPDQPLGYPLDQNEIIDADYVKPPRSQERRTNGPNPERRNGNQYSFDRKERENAFNKNQRTPTNNIMNTVRQPFCGHIAVQEQQSVCLGDAACKRGIDGRTCKCGPRRSQGTHKPRYTQKRVSRLHDEKLAEHPRYPQTVPDSRVLLQRRTQVTKNTITRRKQSLFSRVPTFELPSFGGKIGRKSYKLKGDIKMNVAPRKDFSNVQKVLDTYMSGKRKDPVSHIETTLRPKPVIKPRFKTKTPTTKTTRNPINTMHYINDTIPKPPNMNHYMNNKFHYPGFKVKDESIKHNNVKNINEDESIKHDNVKNINEDESIKHDNVKNINEESDRKLMTLLDNLEQEVKHIELNVDEKEIFDAKIRKIYGTVVGKPPESLERHRKYETFEEKKRRRDDFMKYEPDLDDTIISDNIEDPNKKIIDKEIFETEDRITQLHSTGHENYPKSLYARPISRDQNALTNFNDKDYDNNNNRYTLTEIDDYRRKIGKNVNIDNDKNFNPSEQKFVSNINRIRESRDKERDYEVKSVPYQNKKRLRDKERKSVLQYKNEIDMEIPDPPKSRLPYRDVQSQKYERQRFHNNNIEDQERDISRRTKSHQFYEEKANYRNEDEIHLNRIDEPRVRYKEDNMPQGMEYDKRQKYFKNEETFKKYDNDYDKDFQEDVLSADRKKFYQDKLANLSKQVYKDNSLRKSYRNNHESERERRMDRRENMQSLRPSRPEPSNVYVPDRARSLHGF